jgi:hypothetical protein
MWAQVVDAENVVSDFDDGTLQGWTPEPPFYGDLFVATPGNPGLSMQATDNLPMGGYLLARAPVSYTGDLSDRFGISWDEWVIDYGAPTIYSTDVRIEGMDGTIYRTDNAPDLMDAWNQRFARFEEEYWFLQEGSASFADVLQNVVALYMQMDVTALDNGILESRVDNVTLLDPPATPSRLTTWGEIKARK